jgi:dipeptidyl aminopeptidase/acylaminoacyl peptidase
VPYRDPDPEEETMHDTARGMQPKDIGALRQVDDPRVSPDGSQVAFVVTSVDLEENRYRRRVHLAQASGDAPSRPFSAGPGDGLARWSPDGGYLAFVSKDEEGPAEVCVLPVARGGERVVVATLAEAPTELEWSPDGTQLAFVVRDPDPAHYGEVGEKRKPKDVPARVVTRFFARLNGEGFIVDRPRRLMVVPADGSTPPLRLTDGPFQASGLAWSPDGARIAFSSARHDTWDLDGAVDLFTVASGGAGEPVRLTETSAAYSSPSWSPDGARLAYLVESTPMDSPRHHRLGVCTVDGGSPTDVTGDLDRNCAPYGYARAPLWWGDELLCLVEDAGNVHLYAFSPSGGTPRLVVGGDRWIVGFDAVGDTLALAVGTPTTMPELYVRPLSASVRRGAGSATDERKVTDVSAPIRAVARLVAPEPYVARSEDGTEVPCWAMPPVGAVRGRRYPTLLNIHGGPFTSYGNRFFDEFQLQSGAGFGVFYCNPRGSSGYSEAWGRAVRWPGWDHDAGSGWGGVDYEDVMACARDGAARFDWVDPELLGVLGGSYGGYLTSWIIGHTDEFKAACSERAVNNLLTLETSSDIGTFFRAYVGRTHLEDPDAYVGRSPVSFVHDIRTPVLIVHSEDDLRCPMNQAEELFVALRLLGRGPVLVRFPAESHELSRSGAPRHRVERAEIILDWFKERLMGAEQA